MLPKKRYAQKPNKINWKKYINKKTILIAVLAIFVLVAGFFVYTRLRNRLPKVESTGLYEKDEILVGIATGTPFASAAEDGTPAGFEVEIAKHALSTVYPEKRIAFIPIDSQEASYLLRNNEIDIALGMFCDGVLKTQGLSLTTGYFTDGIYAYTTAESSTSAIAHLNKRSVRMMTSEIKTSTAKEAFESRELDVEILSCSSYTDGIDDVKKGNAAALITTSYKAAPYADLLKIDESLGAVSYRMLLWRENKDAATLLSEAIRKMQTDGTLAALQTQYNLIPYVTETDK